MGQEVKLLQKSNLPVLKFCYELNIKTGEFLKWVWRLGMQHYWYFDKGHYLIPKPNQVCDVVDNINLCINNLPSPFWTPKNLENKVASDTL